MSKTLILVVGLLFALGMIFARDRLKRAFQIGAVLYGVVMVARFAVFGFGDSDNLLDLVAVVGVFFLVWLVAWGATRVALRRRERSERPPS